MGQHNACMSGKERAGIAAGIASSALGGIAAAVTRFAVEAMDPVVVSIFRFGVGGLLLMALALLQGVRWPRGRDLVTTAALGALFYGMFFVAYAEALTYTTAARGSLGVSTLPLLTMVVAATLGRESLTVRKCAGVSLAFGGVSLALAADLGTAPPDAWRGDLIMIAAMFSMSLYTIYSRPLMARSSALGYACAGMTAGAVLNVAVACMGGVDTAFVGMEPKYWLAGLFLGVFPGALGFFLWVYAIERTTPTRVANTITVSPLAAGVVAVVLVGEPFGAGLALGIMAVAAGIWIASTAPAGERRP